MSAAELRLAWAALGIVLLAANAPFARAVLLASVVPWGAGLALLAGARGGRVAAHATAALARPATRLALAGVLALAALVAVGFGPLAGLLALTAVAAAAIAAGDRGAAPLAEVVEGAALGGLALALLLIVVNAIVARGPLAERIGTPAARARWDAHYDSLWARHPFGFRSTHATVARAPGVRRVLAVGDSYTWGDKVASSDSTWTSRLERRLAAAGPVEVINAAQRGWTTANEAEFLATTGWQFAPDLLVVQFFANDALPSGPGMAREGEAWTRLLPSRFREEPAGRSALVYLAERVVNQWQRSRDTTGGYGALYAEDAAGWRQLRAALREMGDSARARDARALLVLFPAFVPGRWTPEQYPLRDVHARVAAAARAAGFVTLDLAPVFAATGRDAREWWALPWDSHPSAAAHAVAADAIAAAIAGESLLAPPPAQSAAGPPAASRR